MCSKPYDAVARIFVEESIQGLTVYKALKLSNAKVGQWIAISGAGGGLGHLAIQYATAMGLRVLAIDTGDQKKALCLKLGAEKWVDFKDSSNLVEDVQAACDGKGPHAAVVAAGHVRVSSTVDVIRGINLPNSHCPSTKLSCTFAVQGLL
ncbi:alcohol dehydrogenase [Stygiomarasmius scandens]|uniref:Alcohol dehydrogenase n=1 Tax=Marasmiellus scandens TaxID=2682957 RepID=A0ABR1IQX5_9AGAR